MPASPLVSVIVPTYKRPQMLGRAIDSLLAQDYENLEVVVVNDNPHNTSYFDQTCQVLQRFENNPRVRLVTTTGKTGGGAARNYAEKFCRGEYLTFLDDDDVYLPDKVSTQLAFMLQNELELCYEDVCWYTTDEKLVEHRKLDWVHDFTKEELLRQHILHSLAPSAVYMVKRSTFEKTEGFGEVPVGQDWFLMLRCIEAGAKTGYFPECHLKQYLHPGERLSTGKNKIDGENRLYEYKRRYYRLLSPRDRRYVAFRHFAVLTFASMRSNQPVAGVLYGIRTFFISPVDSFAEAKRYLHSKR